MSDTSRTRLFLVSFAALFFEVLLIRWIATEVTVFGYFKNLILMGSFVGLGLGCATARRLGSSLEEKKIRAIPMVSAPYPCYVVLNCQRACSGAGSYQLRVAN